MSQLETVTVKREGGRGRHIINKSDFDPARHELWVEPGTEAPSSGGDDGQRQGAQDDAAAPESAAAPAEAPAAEEAPAAAPAPAQARARGGKKAS